MTPRWTKIVEANGSGLSGPRREYYRAGRELNRPGVTVRFLVIPCGRRSLKTEIASRIMAMALGDPKPWDDPRYGILGPTRDQVKRIQWEKMKALIPNDWKQRTFESDLMIRMKSGAELWLLGMDKPQRIEGPPWDGLHITEYADCKIAWDQNVRPAIADRRGWAILEGTPDFEKPNNVKYEEQYNLAVSGQNPAWRAFNWSSESVLNPAEVADMRATMDPLLFEQEVWGKFVRTPNLAYYAFLDQEEGGNLSSTIEVDPDRPIYIACDFNFAHHNWILGQVENRQKPKLQNGIPIAGRYDNERHIHVLKQIYLQNADVDGMCVYTQELLKQIEVECRRLRPGFRLDPKSVIFTGDFSGNQRKAEATARAWETIQKYFPKAQLEVKLNPNVPDRLRDVNNYIVNVNKVRRLHVRPECHELRKDLRYVTRTELMTQDKSGDRTHASDALGYWINVIENY